MVISKHTSDRPNGLSFLRVSDGESSAGHFIATHSRFLLVLREAGTVFEFPYCGLQRWSRSKASGATRGTVYSFSENTGASCHLHLALDMPSAATTAFYVIGELGGVPGAVSASRNAAIARSLVEHLDQFAQLVSGRALA